MTPFFDKGNTTNGRQYSYAVLCMNKGDASAVIKKNFLTKNLQVPFLTSPFPDRHHQIRRPGPKKSIRLFACRPVDWQRLGQKEARRHLRPDRRRSRLYHLQSNTTSKLRCPEKVEQNKKLNKFRVF